ncbi:MAG: hypothetical protein ACYTXA_17080 [Nostoc sp.]
MLLSLNLCGRNLRVAIARKRLIPTPDYTSFHHLWYGSLNKGKQLLARQIARKTEYASDSVTRQP